MEGCCTHRKYNGQGPSQITQLLSQPYPDKIDILASPGNNLARADAIKERLVLDQYSGEVVFPELVTQLGTSHGDCTSAPILPCHDARAGANVNRGRQTYNTQTSPHIPG